MKTKREKIGTVGVDAGMIYLGDPCYVIDKPLGATPFEQFLGDLYASDPAGINADHWVAMGKMGGGHTFPAGLVVANFGGDGEFPVYVTRDKDGMITSVTIDFGGE